MKFELLELLGCWILERTSSLVVTCECPIIGYVASDHLFMFKDLEMVFEQTSCFDLGTMGTIRLTPQGGIIVFLALFYEATFFFSSLFSSPLPIVYKH